MSHERAVVPLDRDVAYVIHQSKGLDYLLFKRIASASCHDYFDLRGHTWKGQWEVVMQTGTARIDLIGANVHRSILGVFETEAQADAFMRERGVQS